MKDSDREPPEGNYLRGYWVADAEHVETRRLDMVGFLKQTFKFRSIGAAIIAISLAAGIMLALFLTPKFRSEALLSPVDSSVAGNSLEGLTGQLGGLAALAGVGLGAGNDLQRHIAILESREFTLAFIEQNSLMPILFEDEWDQASESWIVADPKEAPSLQDAFELFDEEVRFVREDRRSGLVILEIEWNDRFLAAKWANEIIRHLNDYVRQRDIAEATDSIEYLQNELEKIGTVELRRGIQTLIQSQIEKITLANVRLEYAFQIIDKAVPSDADKAIWPNKLLFVAGALFVGLILALSAMGTMTLLSQQGRETAGG